MPDARTGWLDANPRKNGPRTPVVIVDADWDPPAKPLGGRLAAAAAGLLIALGGGAAWLGISSIPASPASREPVASAPAPVTAAPPMAPSASSDTFLPRARDAAPRTSATPAPVRPKRPAGTTRAPVVRRSARDLEPGFLSVNAIPWGSVYLDGRPVGNTPQIDLQVAAGPHRLRVERDGYRPYDRVIDVASGQRLRITDIALAER
jgi:PEGA domain-containing protein